MTVPFHRVVTTDAEIAAVTEAMRSGWWTSGPQVRAFEQEFAARVGARHAVAVNSGTMGALVALSALGVGPGTRVAVPVWTFSGPAMMAWRLGATVVPCDVAWSSLNLEEVPPCDVVMPTHFAGLPVDLGPYDGVRLDDAAHAFPVEEVGTSAAVTFFSFYATKTLATGEGGMLTTDDDGLAAHMRQLRQHGFDAPVDERPTPLYDIVAPGWKANMSDLTAALGRVQLATADERLAKRRAIALRYSTELRPDIRRPMFSDYHAWHLYVIRVPQRDRFIAAMQARGVQCSVHFVPLHRLRFWRGVWGPLRFPNADRAHEEAVSLPIFPSMTESEVSQVIEAANAC